MVDRKRRGGPLEGIPEAKRPTRSASARSDRTAPAAAGRGGSASAAAGRGAAAAAAAADAAAPKPEETWEDIAERTGMTADDVLNR